MTHTGDVSLPPRKPDPHIHPERETWSLAALQEKLGVRFHQPHLLELALTHTSWANEHDTREHNERLEFLGDAVLELHISLELYRRFPLEREGTLTRLRSRLVSEKKLAQLALDLGLGLYLRMGKGEEAQGGRQRPALLADALESVLGAICLDAGHEEAGKLVNRLYADHWPEPDTLRQGKDFKTRLQEVTQLVFKKLPHYVLTGNTGPEHARCFDIRLDLPDGRSVTASGSSVKRAEQEAARLALDLLGDSEEHLERAEGDNPA